MTFAIGIVLIALAAAFVAAPFFDARLADAPAGKRAETAVAAPVGVPTAATVDRPQLERRKLEAYAAIKDTEFDFRMGKLSDADFATSRDKYAAQALEAISALDAAQPRPTAATGRQPARIKFCPACGHGVPPRANFCPACGRALNEAVA